MCTSAIMDIEILMNRNYFIFINGQLIENEMGTVFLNNL